MRIIVTAGATREPIDDVRFISNISTGATGAAMADAFAAQGDRVLFLGGEGAVKPLRADECRTFTTAENLLDQLRFLLAGGDFHAVIQCAAVADYRPVRFTEGKIPSTLAQLHLKLEPTPKILPQIKGLSRTPIAVIGFKLTSGADEVESVEAVSKVLASNTVDAVVHNDLDHYAEGFRRPFALHTTGRPVPEVLDGLEALCTRLRDVLQRGSC